MRFGKRFFFTSLYRKIKDENPSISEDFTKTLLKWPRDRLETMTSMLVLQGGKTFCATFCASLIACVCSFSSPEPVVSGYKLSRVALGTRMAFVCVVLWEFWLRLNEIHEVRNFAPCKGFFFVFVVVFSSLENYFGFRTTNVRVKTDHSVSLRWNKTFCTFPNRFVFFW